MVVFSFKLFTVVSQDWHLFTKILSVMWARRYAHGVSLTVVILCDFAPSHDPPSLKLGHLALIAYIICYRFVTKLWFCWGCLWNLWMHSSFLSQGFSFLFILHVVISFEKSNTLCPSSSPQWKIYRPQISCNAFKQLCFLVSVFPISYRNSWDATHSLWSFFYRKFLCNCFLYLHFILNRPSFQMIFQL